MAVRELSKIAYQPFLTRRDTCIELPTQHACCVWVANTYRTTVCATPRAARVPSNARINHVNMCNCFRGANSKPPHTSSYRETVVKHFVCGFCFSLHFSQDSATLETASLHHASNRWSSTTVSRLNRSRYPWRQLAGHPDSFVKAQSAKWILKLSSATERAALSAATKDPALRGVVVRFDGITKVDAKEYLVLRNML